MPRRAVVAKQAERNPRPLEELDAYYGASYAENLY